MWSSASSSPPSQATQDLPLSSQTITPTTTTTTANNTDSEKVLSEGDAKREAKLAKVLGTPQETRLHSEVDKYPVNKIPFK